MHKCEIEGTVRISQGRGDFTFARIRNDFAEVELCLHGAHVMSYKPHGHRDILWMSEYSCFEPGKPIRGGIPICWPWFGSHPSDRSMSSHGFARLIDWGLKESEVLMNGATRLRLSVSENPYTARYFPFPFNLELVVTVADSLDLELVSQNPGDKEFLLSEAFHSYFSVSHIKDVSVEGLDGFEYIDTVNGVNLRKKQIGPVRFDSEVDRIYLDAVSDCIVRDQGWDRKIHVAKSCSRNTVVWNPWIAKSARMSDFGDNEYEGMLCVEAVNTLDYSVVLAPGATHSMKTSISV